MLPSLLINVSVPLLSALNVTAVTRKLIRLHRRTQTRMLYGKWRGRDASCTLRPWHARETVPLPSSTTCLNFNRSCRWLVQRYYLRLPRLCYQIPPRWRYRRIVTRLFPIFPSFHQDTTKERPSRGARIKNI